MTAFVAWLVVILLVFFIIVAQIIAHLTGWIDPAAAF